jgi:potassium efflux system protein
MNNLNNFLLFTFLFVVLNTWAQGNPSSVLQTKFQKEKKLDSLMQILHAENLKENRENYDLNVLLSEQNSSFNGINQQIQKAKVTLKEGIDYKGFTSELALLIEWKEKCVKGIINDKSKIQTVRELTTTSILLNELLKRTNFQLQQISVNNQALSGIQRRIDSMAISKVFYQIPIQEVPKKNYYQQMALMTKDLSFANQNLKNAIDSIQKLEVKGNKFKFDLESDIALVNFARKELDLKMKSGISDVVESKEAYLSLVENFKHSFVKGYLLFVFYVANQSGILGLLVFFIIGLTFYLRVIRSKYKEVNLFGNLKYPAHALNYPFLSAILIMISIFQFFLPSPPFVFMAFLWIICGIALTIILKKAENKYWYLIWIAFFILNNIVFQDNLLLLYSQNEARFIAFFSLIGLILGLFIFSNRKKTGKEITEKSFRVSLIIFIVFEFIALILILFNNYNLGKILMTNGYFTIFIVYQLRWAYRISNDILNLSLYFSKSEEDLEKDPNNELNAEKNLKVSGFTYALFAVGWYVLISRNSYSFQNFTEPIIESIYQKRQFGEFTFSFDNLFLFFFILFMSGLSARIVSFLTTESNSNGSGAKKSALGSWLLLIRIAIITLGVLLAFISIGIPMDKIALMISALSVGIGFGLQNVINNLVSGLIIAFEKPINLDDIVEVGGNMGKMKSIGIRSSVITTWDGADVIIPNGDLLSQHLVNWTMGSNRRRFEIDLGVAYGSDLNQVKTIITNVLMEHELILKNPSPMVWVTKFGESSIDFVIKYWVPHFNFGNDVRNDIIIAIDIAFKTNGIEIPFPQQDVHIQSNIEINTEGDTKETEN